MSDMMPIQKVAQVTGQRPAEVAAPESPPTSQAQAALSQAAQVQAAQAPTPVAASAQAAKSQSAHGKEASQANQEQTSSSVAARTQLPITKMSDIRLKYQVNPDTKELTVLVIDRSSKKVIRTIPQDELKNFREGDLLELSS